MDCAGEVRLEVRTQPCTEHWGKLLKKLWLPRSKVANCDDRWEKISNRNWIRANAVVSSTPHYAQASPADSSTTMVSWQQWGLNSISFHGLSRLPLNASRWLNSESKSTKRATLSHLLQHHSVFCFNAQAAVYNQHACWWYRTCKLLFIFLITSKYFIPSR